MTTTLAEADVIEMPDDDTRPLYEVVDGVEVEKSMSLLSQLVGSEINTRVRMHVLSGEADGYVTTEPWVVCFDWSPGTKRRPDVAYWRRDQYPDGIPARGEATVPPAWVVEVLSPNELVSDLNARIADYFRAGTLLIWVADPANRTIRTEQADGTAHAYRADDRITAKPVVPGFSIRVAELFTVG